MKSKLPVPIQLSNIEISVTEAKIPIKNLVGFVEIVITDISGNVIFAVRGFTIKIITSKTDSSLIFKVDAPAYPGRFKMNKSFIINNKSLWRDFEKTVLDCFFEETGGKKPEDYSLEEKVEPNDIPF